MLVLHVIAPSPTEPCLPGLLRLATAGMAGQRHAILVLGDQAAADALRRLDLPVIGSVGGCRDLSRTLSARVGRVVASMERAGPVQRVLAWGWQAAAVTSQLRRPPGDIAFIDGIDRCPPMLLGQLRVLPTSWTLRDRLLAWGVDADRVCEPLIGVEPATSVQPPGDLRLALGLRTSDLLVLVIGHGGAIDAAASAVEFTTRMDAAGCRAHLVVLRQWRAWREVRAALREQGISRRLHVLPPGVRPVDAVTDANLAWVEGGDSDRSLDVLGPLRLAWYGMPLMAMASHPLSGVPTVGARLARAQGVNDVCRWCMEVAADREGARADALAVAGRLQSIAAPSRFVEGLRLRCA